MRVWMKRIFLLAVMACYLAFAYLLYQRWVATEQAVQSPVPFAALVVFPSQESAWDLSALRSRVGWGAILTPLWIADGLTVIAHVSLLVVHHAWRSLPAALNNARIEHASGALRAVLYAAFKVLLLHRLNDPDALVPPGSLVGPGAVSSSGCWAQDSAAGANLASWPSFCNCGGRWPVDRV